MELSQKASRVYNPGVADVTINVMVLQWVGFLLYLPYNGRNHCLIWEKKTNDLNETEGIRAYFGAK